MTVVAADSENSSSLPHDNRDGTKRTRSGVSLHTTVLLLSLGVLAASILLDVDGGRKVSIPVWNVPIPETCTWHRFTGWDCPGCGLTRSFISLGHGQFLRALAFNPVGPLLFALTVFQIPYRIVQLVRIRQGKAEWVIGYFGSWLFVTLLVALFVQWLVRMVCF
jgi:WD40 repeat protein